MQGDWLEIRLTVPTAAVELVGQALLELGCTGINVSEVKLDTFEPPVPEADEETPTIRAYFPDGNLEHLRRSVRAALRTLAPMVPGLPTGLPDCRRLPNEDWAHDWQQHFPAFKVGSRLMIRPSWDKSACAGTANTLTLDPGRAFGTGTHATTALCLDIIARLADSTAPPHRVLDVGTGSGILAMSAAALGASEVVACEIDRDACQVAADNVATNHLQHLVKVTSTPLEELTGYFDLILANILAGENIRLAPYFLAHLAPGAHLVLSGILTEQEPLVVKAFDRLPLQLKSVDRRDGWSCLLYCRHV